MQQLAVGLESKSERQVEDEKKIRSDSKQEFQRHKK